LSCFVYNKENFCHKPIISSCFQALFNYIYRRSFNFSWNVIMTTRWELANILFPDVNESIEDLLKKYPEREEKKVLRFAPSPTWYLHFWGLYTSFIGWKYAKQNNGKMLLRIEDTDQKREIEWAAELLIQALKNFWIQFDEGPLNINEEFWAYGPYTQSKRANLYRVFAKYLVAQWLAYPCWMSEERLNEIREMQTVSRIIPWIYGNYSEWRNKNPDELLAKYHEEGNKFPVLRFRSHWDTSKKIVFKDMIRWEISMADNYNDIVLIKADGLPTYHLAHIVDDTLMRVTTITRGEEWLTSVPLHLQLFQAFNLPAPEYCHLAPICKLEDGKKRKLSKRKDPEANVEYFFENWYPPKALLEYIMTLADSSYEDWQRENEDKNYLDFNFSLEKMNVAWPLFDFVKLQNISNGYLSKLSTEDLYNQGLAWAEKYHNELATLMKKDPEYTISALNIERHTEKDPKRFTLYTDIEKNILFFFDEKWDTIKQNKPEFPESIPMETWKAFAADYAQNYDISWDVLSWFDQLKTIWNKYWFAANNAEFKQWGFIGKVWDLAMFLRIQLCWAKQTPDLFSVMKVLWDKRIKERLLDL